ncbi:uncharacterized protein RHOBADRAFT_55473 [Rhodotorula graminis WP1]|uniref:Protein PNS1 n=1 Tax=Rhodotorula graminis (strain WP1) TaxID=578459 RepID=A0A0P9ITP8_RHOGW|nr:uncharacterized protein RHOBADRAFT_55473 [Rhodotorula graminis WP1]KPV72790.1 hypothetical protein RHOBADRAFT_55473 [Rhodotorula graminis WP1]
MNFSQFASNLLQSTSGAAQPAPLFYSTRTDWVAPPPTSSSSAPPRRATADSDILGASDDSLDHHRTRTRSDRRFSLASDDASDDDGPPPPPTTTRSYAAHGMASHLQAIPAFVSRLGGRAPARPGRGWRAYESVAPGASGSGGGAASRGGGPGGRPGAVYSDGEDDETDDGDDDEPLPGAFVSLPLGGGGGAARELPLAHAMDEPLVGRRTLFVYPVPGPGGGGANAHEAYRDTGWVVAYGVSLLAVAALALHAWWSAPPLPPGAPSASVLVTLPTLSLLALVSLVAGVASLAYLLAMRRALATLLTLAVFGGPVLFVATGIVAFAGSFATRGVASDGGWTTGVRWFAVACFVLAFVLGRTALSRRKELNRAISVGELACDTVLNHPPLILLALTLSLLSAVITLPFASLIASLLAHAPQSPHLASWGSALTLLVFFWTLAIGRGVSHAVVGGCIGTWYFEREGDEYQGPLEVTRAAIVRATGPSFGTVIAASFFLAIFETLATVCRTLHRALSSSRLPTLLRPLAVLAPLFRTAAAYAAFFNSYSLSYAGMTGEPFLSASRETAALFRLNRARNIRDTALLRLTLFISSSGFGLLFGLAAFLFLSSSQLSPSSGRAAPTLAVLSYAIPLYTTRVCHSVVADAVDALYVATNLDAENQISHCPKAVEAFGTPEADSFGSLAV